jgi:hypothetical protein
MPREKNLSFGSASWYSSALDLLPSHEHAKIWISLYKVLMRILPESGRLAIFDPIEPIDVQLADEGFVLAVRKELGECSLRELIGVQDLEGCPVRHPGNVCQIFILTSGCFIEHFMQAKWEIKLE